MSEAEGDKMSADGHSRKRSVSHSLKSKTVSLQLTSLPGCVS